MFNIEQLSELNSGFLKVSSINYDGGKNLNRGSGKQLKLKGNLWVIQNLLIKLLVIVTVQIIIVITISI